MARAAARITIERGTVDVIIDAPQEVIDEIRDDNQEIELIEFNTHEAEIERIIDKDCESV